MKGEETRYDVRRSSVRHVGYTPHVRVDMILHDADIDKVLEAMRGNNCGVTGRCIYWVTPVIKAAKL